jgi:hypothetical protein
MYLIVGNEVPESFNLLTITYMARLDQRAQTRAIRPNPRDRSNAPKFPKGQFLITSASQAP